MVALDLGSVWAGEMGRLEMHPESGTNKIFSDRLKAGCNSEFTSITEWT